MDQVRDNINKFIEEVALELNCTNAQILEFGTGQLDHNKKLFSPGNHYIATDVVVTPHTDFTADITDALGLSGFERGVFDLIIVSEVLEHVFNYQDALHTCNSLLKMGGHLLVTIPWEYPEHGEDYWRYSERTIDRLLSTYGFLNVRQSAGYVGASKTNIFRLAKKVK